MVHFGAMDGRPKKITMKRLLVLDKITVMLNQTYIFVLVWC